MIVTQDTPISPTKSSNSQSESPPAYYQYQGYSSIPQSAGSRAPMPPPMATSSTPVLIKRPERRRAKACGRFFKAFAIAVLIYFLAAAFFGSWTWKRNVGGGESHWGGVDPEWPEYTGFRGSWQIAQEGCSNAWEDSAGLLASDITAFPDIDIDIPDWGWPGWDAPYHAHTSFTLAPEAVKHLIVGNRAYGSIDFTTSTSTEQKNIRIDITAYYYLQSTLDQARVCKLNGKGGGEGVGLYMPNHLGRWHTEDQINFKVTVTFPLAASHSSSGSVPLVINEFETYLSIFKHNLHDLRDKVFFRSLILRSSNSRINADVVSSARADIRTSNGGISGRYQVNDTLRLETSNGKVDVDLEVEDSGRRANGVDVVLKTSNAVLMTTANLYASQTAQSAFKSAKGGRFSIDARTSNGHLSLNIPTIPFDSALKLVGRTSNSPADVSLDKRGSFEGTYKLDTSSYMGIPTVQRADRDDQKDGQRRILERSFGGKGSSQGRVYWGRWDQGRDGTLELKTSNAKVSASI